jgi:hypothetical protein
MLEHLILYTRRGLCNRMRAIASAKRISSRAGARCTIAWDWGDYRSVFEDDTEWLACDPCFHAVPAGYAYFRHLLRREGGNDGNRRVPVTKLPRIALQSHYVFGPLEEPALRFADVVPWLPKPHPFVLERVKAFRENSLPAEVVGIHMRRTDHRQAVIRSPDEAFFDEADQAIEDGFEIFLATDNQATLRMMSRRYGRKLHHRRKHFEKAQRWPRTRFVIEDLLDDMIDLWLLAACDYVIGSEGSSYSMTALALNGGPRSRYAVSTDLITSEKRLVARG